MRTRLLLAIVLPSLWLPDALAAQHRHDGHHPPSAPPGVAAHADTLQRQLAAIREATARYRDIAVAKADGFVRFGRTEGALMGEHWYRKGAPEPASAATLDLVHPATLQYATIDGERRLVGVAFSVRLRPGDPMPAGFAGPEDHWHQHDVEKFVHAATSDRPVLRWLASRAAEKRRRAGDDRSMLTMVHAWVWLDNPDGPFAMNHRALPYLRAGLPAAWASLPEADEDAARGIGLVAPDGCRQALDGELWMANASRAQRRTLEASCATQADAVRRALDGRPEGAAANAVARAAWRALESVRGQVLTDEQRARIASVTEHTMMK